MAGLLDLLGLGGGSAGTMKTPGRSPLNGGGQQGSAPSWLNRNSEMLLQMGLGGITGRNAQEQAAGMGQGLIQGMRTNRTAQWLEQNDPELAKAFQSGMLDAGDALKLAFARKTKAEEAKRPDRQWVELGDGTFGWADKTTGSFTKLGSAPKATDGGGKYGLNPVWGVDPATNETRLGQLSSDGTFKVLDLPPSFQPSTGTGTVDLGSEVGTVDRRTGSIISRTPKDNRGASRDKELGKTDAGAISSLPSARSLSEQVDTQVQRLKTDPYLDSMLGPWDSRTPNFTTDAARVQGYMDQLSGGAFLQGRQLLKGGGAITDFESKKAEAAFARLNAAQSPEDYKTALDDFNIAVMEGVRKLEQQAAEGGYVPQYQPQSGGGGNGGGYNQSSSGVRWRAK